MYQLGLGIHGQFSAFGPFMISVMVFAAKEGSLIKGDKVSLMIYTLCLDIMQLDIILV